MPISRHSRRVMPYQALTKPSDHDAAPRKQAAEPVLEQMVDVAGSAKDIREADSAGKGSCIENGRFNS